MKRPDARKVYLFLVFSVGFLIVLGFGLSYCETTAARLNTLQFMSRFSTKLTPFFQPRWPLNKPNLINAFAISYPGDCLSMERSNN